MLYVNYAGYADTNPYHGYLLGYNPSTLQLLTNYMFVTTPNATTNQWGSDAGEGGIWMAGSGLSVDSSTNLYFEVGNGTFTATNGTTNVDFGDCFIKLSTTNNKLAVADFFAPYNQSTLASNDTDLGSSGLLLLPDQTGTQPHLLVGGGKEGKTYLINRDAFTTNNNHYNSGGSTDAVLQTLPAGKTGRSTGSPAYFNGWVYLGGWGISGGSNIMAFAVTNGLLSTSAVATGTRKFSFPGTTLSVSGNGTNNGIVWSLQHAAPGVFSALNATNLTELFNSTQLISRDGLTNSVKFTVPTVANGKVYIGSQYSVYVFGLLGGNLAIATNAYTVVEANTNVTVTVTRTGGTNGAAQVSYSTYDGTATSGADYVATTGTLSWANGDTANKTFTIPILDDNLAEPNETINLVLSNSAGAYLSSPSTAVITILEDIYESWKYTHFTTNANNAAISGDLADPDGDHIPNLLEYALASDPNTSGTEGNLTAAIVNNQLQLYFRRNISATNLTYIVQTGDTIGHWTPLMTYTLANGWFANTAGATFTESAATGVSPDRYVNVTITDPNFIGDPANTNHFFQLAVHR